MTSKKQGKNNSESKGVCKLCIFLTWGFSFMTYCCAFTANEKKNYLLFGIIGVIAISLTVWGVILSCFKISNLEHKLDIYFGVSCIAYSLAFFWMYYEILYKILAVDNIIYLALGLVGYFVIVGAVLYYRNKVNKGDFKDKSGAPNYMIISLLTILGSIVARGYFDKLEKDSENFILAIFALFLSYVFSLGVVPIYETYLKQKIKKN